APGGVHLLVERDELAQGGAGEVLDVAEVEQDLAPAELVHQAEELLADDLDVLLVEDLLVGEIHDSDIADVFDFEAAPTRLGGHAQSPLVSLGPPSSGTRFLFPGQSRDGVEDQLCMLE